MKKLFGHVKPKNKSKDPAEEFIPAAATPIHATHARYLAKPPPKQKLQDPQRHSPPQPASAIPSPVPTSASVHRTYSGEDRYDHPQHYTDSQKQGPPGIAPSRSSSFHSIPPPLSSPVPSPHPRPASPSTTNTSRQPYSPNQNDGARPAKKVSSTAPVALGILKALDPHATPLATQQYLVRSQSEERFSAAPDRYTGSENGHSVREPVEKKEKRGFWSKDRDRDKPQDPERDRRQKDAQLERAPQHEPTGRSRDNRDPMAADRTLTSMIGYLTATAAEDWSVVLEVCDRASASEANAKEAVRSLRSEFKYGQPPAQMAASKLWAIMLRNASDIFIAQSRARKFLDTLEQLLKSPHTSPVVSERLLEIVAAAAYASGRHRKGSEKDGFRGLWLRVKPADKPDEGIPFDSEDAMFNPPSRGSIYDIPTVAYQQPSPLPDGTALAPNTKPARIRQKSPNRNRIIPPEEDIRRLFQECKMGQGNANLLSEALVTCTPSELRKSEIINEFYQKCQASQELIYAQIEWAYAGAERSRVARDHERRERPISDEPYKKEEETIEEKLLAALLVSNEQLLEALRQYDDLAQIADEKRAEARSRKEVRINRKELETAQQQQPQGEFVGASSSRSPSPSLSRSHSPSGGAHANYQRPYPPPIENDASSLAPPPKAPYGPRSPGPRSVRSRTPSLNGHHHDDNAPGVTNGYPVGYDNRTSGYDQDRQPSSYPMNYDLHRHSQAYQDDTNSSIYYGQEVDTATVEEFDPEAPVRPSEKALGKRKAPEAPPTSKASIHSDELYLDQDTTLHEDRFESDNESTDGRWHRPPTLYIYDAAAERTQQRLDEAHKIVNGVH